MPDKLPDGRMAYFIPLDAHIEGQGYRASLVFENGDGHYPTGTWPYEGKPGQSMPYFWGHDYDKACETADRMNEQLGLSKKEALMIVARSMGRSRAARGS